MASESESDSTFNSRRRLCSDGSCVGLIGSDGKCTVCGTRDDGEQSLPSPDSPAHDDFASDDFDGPEVEPIGDMADGAAPGFDPNRRLCSDDTCVGVIGEDALCRVCRKPAAG